MRIIINAEPDEMAHAMGIVVEAMKTFARHPERVGWGWNFSAPGGRSFFVRRTKGGFSATPSGEGAIALISSRTERDLPVAISVELFLNGRPRSPERTAELAAALVEALGEADASRLLDDGGLQTVAKDTAAADLLAGRLRTIRDDNQDILHLRVSMS